MRYHWQPTYTSILFKVSNFLLLVHKVNRAETLLTALTQTSHRNLWTLSVSDPPEHPLHKKRESKNKSNKVAHGGDGGGSDGGVYLARAMTESTGSIARKADST